MTKPSEPPGRFSPAAAGGIPYWSESFSPEEEEILARFFTSTRGPVFAVVNLPEVVKGALFARYSRSPKSARRLFLDEFYHRPEIGFAELARRDGGEASRVRLARAEKLYERIFVEYGDDSVAQVGGAHLACEQASNLLTKVLEHGRLAAYLEQSTRYIFYDQPLGGRYRFVVPPEIAGSAAAHDFEHAMERLFEAYSRATERLVPYFESLFPRTDGDPKSIWRATIRAKACDTARGLLPAAALSNLGIFASGQAYEMLLIRMFAHPLREVRDYATMILAELRKVIPAFLRRVDLPERGVAWSGYTAAVARRMEGLAAALERESRDRSPEETTEVTLVEWDPEAEVKTVAAALYRFSGLSDRRLLEMARAMPEERRLEILRAYVGERRNRRHKPGRGMERASYRFDVVTDYAGFRDLQRHRMLTIEWQRLGTALGYVTPPAVEAPEVGLRAAWDEALAAASELHGRLAADLGADVAQYAVPMAYRIRFVLQMNVREAFHLLELRTQREGHPHYRRVCQEMHRLIAEQAGHRALAAAMRFVDHGHYDLERLEAERRAEQRRRGR